MQATSYVLKRVFIVFLKFSSPPHQFQFSSELLTILQMTNYLNIKIVKFYVHAKVRFGAKIYVFQVCVYRNASAVNLKNSATCFPHVNVEAPLRAQRFP